MISNNKIHNEKPAAATIRDRLNFVFLTTRTPLRPRTRSAEGRDRPLAAVTVGGGGGRLGLDWLVFGVYAAERGLRPGAGTDRADLHTYRLGGDLS